MRTFKLWRENRDEQKTAWENLYSMVTDLYSGDYLDIEAMIDPVVEQLRALGLEEEANYLLQAKMPDELLSYINKKNDHYKKYGSQDPKNALQAAMSFKFDAQLKKQYDQFVQVQTQIISDLYKKIYRKMKDMGFINNA